MAIQISISNAIGSRYRGSVVPPIDPDAQAFITAASITDPTQQSAINQLVVDLKGYGVWTKMKALYPFIGGTSVKHSYNLRNTAQYQITWGGGVTHNSNGITGSINGFGNTGLIPSSALTNNSLNVSVYARTDAQLNETQLGCSTSSFLPIIGLSTWNIASQAVFDGYDYSAHRIVSATLPNGKGFYHGNILSSTNQKFYKNGSSIGSVTTAQTQTQPSVQPIYILARNDSGTAANYSARNLAFASIGDGLTDTEAANFYTAVQTFQVTLGRSIGTQTVSDADAQAFVTNAGIVDQVEANAINNLVIGLKADSLWTKMKACYPMVGGSSSTMKYNLKNPLDTDAAFRLVFNGGWTFSSTGATPNGTNAYADTKFNDSTHFTSNTNGHISAYIRTDFPVAGNYETIIGCSTDNNGTRILTRRGTGLDYLTLTDNFSAQAAGNYSDKLKGQYLLTKDGTNRRYFKNSTLLHTAANGTNGAANRNIYLGAENYPVVTYYSNRELAFATIGDNLTNTDSANLYTRIQNMQTALNRNV